MDKCKLCIKKKVFPREICQNCGAEDVEVVLEGACLVGTCQKCGASFVGSSFFMPCETDETEYRVRIVDNSYSNILYSEIGKVLKIKPLLLKKVVENGQCIEKEYRLKEVMAIKASLQKAGIIFEILPKPEYKEFYQCQLKRV